MSRPFEKLMVIDYETAWCKKTYTLSTMTTESYIRDPRFKAWGMSWKYYGEGQAQWVDGRHLRDFYASIDWTKTATLAHNAQFDNAILAWHYGVNPCFIFDSYSMARALHGVEIGNSLKKLSEQFKLPPKGEAIHSSNGYLETLPPSVMTELAEYCNHDVWLCEQIFSRLIEGYPSKELRLIDMTIRMFTQPVLELDDGLLKEAIIDEAVKREGLLHRLKVTDKDLASNDKFAELLKTLGVEPPMKKKKPTPKTPNPEGMTYAFAKNDALFQALLNSESEEVAMLCEARLKVKSTLERTRAQRFLDIAQRGSLPVPLHYYGAHTGRWAASRGSGLNMQNLKRGSFLRRAIMAPSGYVLVVCDLSQIEPRVLAWLCDYHALLDIFRSGKDAYAAFGAQMFGIPGLTKESHPQLRQSAKSALLGCFSADTQVLTSRGWVPIVSVQATDMLWDGEEWVRHQGVLPQGEKEVLTAHGVSATSDHEILTERGWVEWREVLADPCLLESALSLVSLPAEGGNGRAKTTIPACGARADGKESLIGITCSRADPHAVTDAQSAKQLKHGGSGRGTSQYVRIERTGIGYWTELARSLFGALTRKRQPIQTTADAVLPYTHSGLPTALPFCGTSWGFPVGMMQHSNSTASTTTKATNRGIFASAPAVRTWQTSGEYPRATWKNSDAASPCLKQRTQTYDIAYAGPRNRYTVLTDKGPLLVHNCGYGLGWWSFAAQLLTGFLGAEPILYDVAFAKQLGVDKSYMQTLLSDAAFVEKALDIPRVCTDEEILIHCVAAKKIIDIYRNSATPVRSLWSLSNELIGRALFGGKRYELKCLTFDKERIILPSGMCLRYPDLRANKADDPDKDWLTVYWDYDAGKTRKKLYGGKVTENVVQSVARCVMTDGMLRIQKRYPCVLTVHDEAVCLVPEHEAEEAEKWVLAQMVKEPPYMPGIPLAAETGCAERYGDAK